MNQSHLRSSAVSITRSTRLRAVVSLLLATLLMTPATPAHAESDPVVLGAAESFAVLAGTGITNTGTTVVSGTAGGDMGSHPTPAFTGVDEVDTTGITFTTSSDAVESAKASLVAAYDTLASRASTATIAGDLGGQTLVAGVYTSDIPIGLTGTLTLDADGDPTAVFIFQTGSTLTTASDSTVVLANGAQACNVFWQVGSSATLGTGSTLTGSVLAFTSITATTGASVTGQLLAIHGAVTLHANKIVNNACASEEAPEPEVEEETTPDQTPETNPQAPVPVPGQETVAGGELPNTGAIEWLIALGVGGTLLTTGVVDIVRRRKAG
jgi:type VI secretion system secreted protein VgrG